VKNHAWLAHLGLSIRLFSLFLISLFWLFACESPRKPVVETNYTFFAEKPNVLSKYEKPQCNFVLIDFCVNQIAEIDAAQNRIIEVEGLIAFDSRNAQFEQNSFKGHEELYDTPQVGNCIHANLVINDFSPEQTLNPKYEYVMLSRTLSLRTPITDSIEVYSELTKNVYGLMAARSSIEETAIFQFRLAILLKHDGQTFQVFPITNHKILVNMMQGKHAARLNWRIPCK
jgi:hypothetical protein